MDTLKPWSQEFENLFSKIRSMVFDHHPVNSMENWTGSLKRLHFRSLNVHFEEIDMGPSRLFQQLRKGYDLNRRLPFPLGGKPGTF